MVVLKSKSQVNNFVKRMSNKLNFNHQEGCGCCYNRAFVYRDDKTNKVILEKCRSYVGDEKRKAEVLAVIKH